MELIEFFEVDERDIVFNNGKPYVELADAFERKFWDLSKNELERAINFIKDNGNDGVMKKMLQIAEKVLTQRQFMKKQKPLRTALRP
ncbi:hypothetical protein [Paenibacillus alkalitolerans]|uniref:hypothetical protein n=1 Tax=Paenibacillus alkalitolerans TaxID=2799335 RepID=UPI0018F36ABE|nr:hypothetical protein [Paenibacillus alkalitolerans]